MQHPGALNAIRPMIINLVSFEIKGTYRIVFGAKKRL